MPQIPLKLYRITAIFYGAFIAYISLLPIEQAVSSGMSDKLDHLLGYALLSFLFIRGFPNRKLQTVVGCVIFGVGIEIIQGYVGRFPEVLDAIANTLGAIVGLSITHYFPNLFKVRETKAS